MTRAQLLRALENLPAGAQLTLPVGDLREALGDETGPADLDVQAVAQRFDRSASTVRSWCEAGLLPGAYRLRGRAWRIPPASLEAFRAGEQETPRPVRTTRGKRARLDAWRGEGVPS